MNREDRKKLKGLVEAEANGRRTFRIKCPFCSDSRRNKKEKTLSVDMDKEVCHCFHCNFAGSWSMKDDDMNYRHRYSKFNYVSVNNVSKKYVRPKFPMGTTQLGAKLEEYFTKVRGISTDTLKKMRITRTTEFMPQSGREENCICFNYFENDVLINVKFRDGAKNFKLVKDAELIPWNIDAVLNEDTCYVCEGEMDAMSLVEVGIDNVVSVPNGAGGSNLEWLDRFIESHFENKKKIVLAMDSDSRGIEFRNELIRRLGSDICYTVQWGIGCKDANEHLVAHGAESLRIALSQAKEIPIKGVFTAEDVRQNIMNIYRNGLPKGQGIGFKAFDSHCMFECGRVVTVTGIPGSGKSEFVDEIVLRLMLKHKWKAAYFSPENQPVEYHIHKVMSRLLGRPFNTRGVSEDEVMDAIGYFSNNLYSVLPENDLSVDNVLSIMASLVRRKGVKVIVIDPYNRMSHNYGRFENETQYIDKVLDKFTNFANLHKVLLILVAHPRKMPTLGTAHGQMQVPTLYDINGSAAFYNKTDYGLVVYRNYHTGQTMVKVEKVRFRHLGSPGESFFIYNLSNSRFLEVDKYEEGMARSKDVAWDNTNWHRTWDATQMNIEFTNCN